MLTFPSISAPIAKSKWPDNPARGVMMMLGEVQSIKGAVKDVIALSSPLEIDDYLFPNV
jgi:hypothetical protein